MVVRILAMVGLTVLFGTQQSLLADTPKPYEVRRDIRYAAASEKNDSKLDVYFVKNRSKQPIAIWIHGGGWRRGDKRAVQDKPRLFLKNGFVFVSVNYRFVPEVTVEEMTGDVANAIKWAHDNAGELGGDSESIYVLGHSAGAHLAALVCTDESYLKKQGLSFANIKACIPVDTAAYDIPATLKTARLSQRSLYHGVFGKELERQKKLSPITHVVRDKKIPPILLLHVASRPDSSKRSNELAKKLKDAGYTAEVFAAKGKDHGSINRDIGKDDDAVTDAILKFLKKVRSNTTKSPR